MAAQAPERLLQITAPNYDEICLLLQRYIAQRFLWIAPTEGGF
jgi:hypothetical protein